MPGLRSLLGMVPMNSEALKNIPVWEMESGKITSVTLHPIDLHQHDPRSRKGSPTLTDSDEALHHLKELSREFGTDIQIKNGKGYIDMTAEA